MSTSRVVDNPEAGRFEIYADGTLAGFSAYQRNGSTVAFTHTEMDPEFEGRGLASVLIRRALDAVRAAGDSVLPFCPFVRAYITRHAEYVDLVPPGQRPRFDLGPAPGEAGRG